MALIWNNDTADGQILKVDYVNDIRTHINGELARRGKPARNFVTEVIRTM